MTDCSDGVAIVSISSSVSRHVRWSGRETGGELDDELLGVSTMSEGANPSLFLSNDTARSVVSKESPGAILARFGFAERSKLCILRTVSKLYYAFNPMLLNKYTSHSIFRMEHCQQRGRSSEHFRLPILHALHPLNDFVCLRFFLVPSTASIWNCLFQVYRYWRFSQR